MLSRRADRATPISDRAGPLFEEAAERSRVSMRTRLERLRLSWRSLLQASVSAAAAWLIATDVLGHPRPFFAPVSAIITLGLTVGQRGRRAVELALGVAVGIAVADLLVMQIGTGAAQLALVVLLATSAAIFLGSGQMMASQAAVSAALVATLQPPTDGFVFTRFFDALIGGGVALAVNALLLPGHPVETVRRAVRPLLEELAETLEDIAAAIDRRDSDHARKALERARGIDELEAVLDEAIELGRETTRYALPRRRSRGVVDNYGDAAARIDLAVRNVRVLARGTIRALSLDDNVPPDIATSLRDLAEATRALRAAIDDPERAAGVREPAIRAAAGASLVLERTGNLSVSVIVGQVRSTAVDLLTAIGLSYDEATADVRAAVQEAQDSVA
jgi:uncharacterized membrane protein YgaE (UPF0421/DUF939 family)